MKNDAYTPGYMAQDLRGIAANLLAAADRAEAGAIKDAQAAIETARQDLADIEPVVIE